MDNYRKAWASLIHEQMKTDKDIIVITPDMGYNVLDEFQRDYPDRYFNVGIAETLATNMAVGMALSGKKPWIYGLISFTIYKALEQIRNFVVDLNLPVKYALSGKEKAYLPIGISHWALEDKQITSAINLPCFEPKTLTELNEYWDYAHKTPFPLYLRLS